MAYHFRVVNPSILLGSLPLDEQLQLVVQNGFEAIELWWPFRDADPTVAEQDAVLSSFARSGLRLVSLNLYEGGMAEGHRGLVCRADQEREIESSLAVARRLLVETGCPNLNVLHGNLSTAEPHADQRARAAQRIATIADDLDELGVTVLVEQLFNVETYGIRTVAELIDTVERSRTLAQRGTIKIQFDFFHLASAGEDLEQLLESHISGIGHIQVADMPQRGGPGTGNLPIGQLLATAERLGYEGEIALEYSSYEHDPFEWMHAWQSR